jgi:hypothetical protein
VRQPGAHIGDILVEIARDGAQQDQIARIILGAGKGLARLIGKVAPEARIRGERHLIIAEPLRGEQGTNLLGIDAVIDPRRRRQRRRADRGERRCGLRPARQFRRLRGGTDIGQAARAVLVIVLARRQLLFPPRIFRGVECAQPRIGSADAGIGRCNRRRREQRERDDPCRSHASAPIAMISACSAAGMTTPSDRLCARAA